MLLNNVNVCQHWQCMVILGQNTIISQILHYYRLVESQKVPYIYDYMTINTRGFIYRNLPKPHYGL